VWFFPLVYAVALASLPVEKYIDRDNYLIFVTTSTFFLQESLGSGILTLLQNEPIWAAVNLVLGLFFENEVVLRIVIFVSSFIFSFSLLRLGKLEPKYVLYAIAICLLPQVMKNYVVHLRQGFAIAVFMLSMIAVTRIPRLAGLTATPFIHSSFFFVQINLLLTWLMKESVRRGLNARAAVFIAIVAVCVTSIAAILMLGFFSARQIEEHEGMFLERSGLGFIFWVIILLIFVFNDSRFKAAHFFAIASILGYIGLYFIFSPAARVFESAMPIVLVSGYELKRGRLLFLSLFTSFFAYQWLAPIVTGGDLFRLAQ
jgi:hypothetical protein